MVSYIDMVATRLRDVRDGSECARAEHNLVLVNEGVLVHAPEDVTSRNVVTDLRHRCVKRTSQMLQLTRCTYFEFEGVKVPLQGTVEGIGVDTSGNVN